MPCAQALSRPPLRLRQGAVCAQREHESSPVFFAAPGAPSFLPRASGAFPDPRRESEGTERREAHPFNARLARREHPWRRVRAPRRSIAAIFVPGAVLPGADGELFAPLIQAAFAALRQLRVQPSKADPRSGAGRLPEASRERGYEPRPQAPRLAPSSKRLATTPSMSQAVGL